MDKEYNITEISAGFLVKERKLLMVKVAEGEADGATWELPGAQLIAGESYEDALSRAFQDGLNIGAQAIQEVGSVELDKDCDILMVMYILVEAGSDNITLNKYSEYTFATFDELQALPLSPPVQSFMENYEAEIKKFID